jgi:uncharacterized membrane protein
MSQEGPPEVRDAKPSCRGSGKSWHELHRYRLFLAVSVGAYFAVSLTLSWLRYEELFTGNWDLGIFQQAFWATAHGHPFYEAGDYEMSGIPSLFQVHPALLLLGLEGVYAVDPSPLALFALQSLVVSTAALPLYGIARDVTGSERGALYAALLYLLWPPLLAANLYDFHLESFLPLELFGFFWLWLRGRYGWGALAALTPTFTLQAGPVLVAAAAVFFCLYPEGLRNVRSQPRRDRGRDHIGAQGLLTALIRRGREPAFRASILLLIEAFASFLLLEYLGTHPSLLGLSPLLPSGVPPRPEVSQGLYVSLAHLGIDLPQKFGYWLALYALVGFLPFGEWRTQIMTLPWLGYTFVSYSVFTAGGNQYAFLPAFPIFLGVAYGLARFFPHAHSGTTIPPAPSRGGPHPDSPKGERRAFLVPSRFLQRSRGDLLPVLIVALLLVGLALGPADPLWQGASLGPGYEVSYQPAPSDARVFHLASLIPSNASVLASNNLFPYVADDLHAFALLWTPEIPPDLPFNASHPPPYVFLCSSQGSSLPGWLAVLLANASVYGLRGQVTGTNQGTVSLFEQGYTGPVWEGD